MRKLCEGKSVLFRVNPKNLMKSVVFNWKWVQAKSGSTEKPNSSKRKWNPMQGQKVTDNTHT